MLFQHGDIGRLDEVNSLEVTDDLTIFRDGVLFRVSADALDIFISAFKTVTVTTSPFTVTDEDLLLVDADTLGAAITINFPTSASRFIDPYGRPITVKNISLTDTHTLTVDPSGSEEADGETTVGILTLQSQTFNPDGSDWWLS